MTIWILQAIIQHRLIQKHKEAFTTLSITVLQAVYVAIGGWMFPCIEGFQDQVGHENMLKALSNIKSRGITDKMLDDIFTELKTAGVKGLPDGSIPIPNWTFENGVLYSITLLTTIGYGHVSPITLGGKLATIFYASIGIPITLLAMSRYVYRLTEASSDYKKYLYKKLRGTMKPVHINLFHVSTVLITIMCLCYVIPGIIFYYLETGWTFLDSIYYLYISLTTIGLGDFVPGANSKSYYLNLYRLCVGFFLYFGVVLMMFMVTMSTNFYRHYHEDLPDDDIVTVHQEKLPFNGSIGSNYGTLPVSKIEVPSVHIVHVPQEEDQQRLL